MTPLPEPSYRIQRLGPDGVAPLRALNAVFGAAFGESGIYGAEPPSDAYLGAVLAKEGVVVLVARSGDEVVGGLVAYELDKLERERREIYIYDLAVAEAHRRRGVATALIDHLREVARARGGWVIYVQADYVDAPAIALYEKLGVREAVLHFDIDPRRTGLPPAVS